MDVHPTEPDYQLLWPRGIFVREATSLLNNRTERDWNERAQLLLADAFLGGNVAGPAADLREISSDQAQRVGWGADSQFQTKSHLSEEQKFLRSLLAAADRLHEDPSPRAYWKERRQGHHLHVETSVLSTQNLANEFVRLVDELDGKGYVDRRFGIDCVDDPRGEQPSRFIEHWLHESDVWPLSAARLGADHDLFFSVVELLHDHVSRPRNPGYYHDYSGCGWHRSGFDASTGREIYRWRANKLLARSEFGLRLADDGEDIGRLVAITDEGRSELVAAVTNRPAGATEDQVRHALALFRARHADRNQKRSAIAALGLVLEERRHTVLEDALSSKDRGDLFRIANEFNIRHQRPGQKSEYDDFYLDWIFWLFLASVELTNRIIDDQRGG